MQKLNKKLIEITRLSSVISVLHWDMEVHMPKGGAQSRADTISYLSVLLHSKMLELNENNLLSNLYSSVDTNDFLSNDSKVIVREAWREYSKQKKLPEDFVGLLAQTTSEAHHVWWEARDKGNFKKFAPYLEKIVALKRKEALYLGYTDSPYDALLDNYEPYSTSKDLTLLLNDLKDFLIPFLASIKASKKILSHFSKKDIFPKDNQKAFNHLLSEKLGFDFTRGKIEESAHPFTTQFHPDDVRFTTRYNEKNLLDSLFSTIHEAGHALYEQGLLSKDYGSALSESISLGIHESQSRFWENVLGRGKDFWKFFHKDLKKFFPKVFNKYSVNDFYEIINNVHPSFIRTEADEVTYNIHVIIRFEIEKALIEGSIEVKDVPKVWNGKMKSYLGVVVTNDKYGVLQDVHWSSGLFGYFPTYTLGNLYSLQFWNTMRKEIKDIDVHIVKGNFKPILSWLRKKIHVHGKRFSADDLIKEVTGEALTSSYFIEYLKEKYGKLYNLASPKIKTRK